jgi:hypothetical protein
VVGAKGLTREQSGVLGERVPQAGASEEWKKLAGAHPEPAHFLGHADSLKFYETEYAAMRR